MASDIYDVAWRLLRITMLTTEVMGVFALVIGAIGYFTTRRYPRRTFRYRNLLIGGSVILVCLLTLDKLYAAITFIMTGTTGSSSVREAFLPIGVRSWQLTDPEFERSIYPITVVVSRASAVLGLAGIAWGTALWGATQRRSPLSRYGRRIISLGVGLMVVSVGSRLFAAIVYVLLPGL